MLGRGGMGEVYRADDLTLRQPVALKFLPEYANDDEEILERFRGEVRTARRVSHPNVCRVYDIGEADGRRFLSMEYVDGEDLASLLRRIGRLPSDKALDVARRVCAGLAAAHAKGVLHRDLKPANVMLDARGHVLITDFGLASLAEEVQGADVGSGTPAYMAPEQLEGREVTVRSDVYSLGLVLYEIFTGRRAFDSTSLEAGLRARAEAAYPRPSELVADLDPAVEGVIVRCLEPDAARRPQSVLAVAAALPGGDPLAAIIAAGDTPSPELVADAGERGGTAPRTAATALAIVVLGIAAAAAMAVRTSGLQLMAPDTPPEALAHKARETLRRLGNEPVPADSSYGLTEDTDLLSHLESEHPSPSEWRATLTGRPSVLSYWYRTSPHALVATKVSDDLMLPGVVRPDEPPATLSGMVNLTLDPRGRLTGLQVMPPERFEDEGGAPVAPDWSALLEAADLDPSRLQPARPLWNSLAASDACAAWTGTWPGTTRPLRVEAAAWRGKPVFLALIGPWTRPARMQPRATSNGQERLLLALACVVMAGGGVLAWRNWRRGRGDRRGALRLASFLFCAQMALWLGRVHPVGGAPAFALLVLAIAHALFAALFAWGLYMALEPYVRRHWPHAIISWSRVLAGRIRDPLVGRDVLFGAVLGVAWTLLFQLGYLALQRLGASPVLSSTEFLMGGRATLAGLLTHLIYSIRGTLILFFLLAMFRVVLRRPALAAAAFVLFVSASKFLGSEHPWVDAPLQILLYSGAAFVVVRFGLVALASGILVADLLLNIPVATRLSDWYMASSLIVVASVLALVGWAFHTSLAGRRLWKEEAFD
jgi:serine/threonine-protein kinase